jgi:CTP synthase (UTP-ammonia lyase)
MPLPLRIALVGDYDPAVIAHRAIPRAIDAAAAILESTVDPHWLPTNVIGHGEMLDEFDAFWCVPGSPYRSMDGALRAIRYARETGRPFLGTCGGFQHAVIEYARHVLGWDDADHGETNPDAARAVISPLTCERVEVGGTVRFEPGSHLLRAYGGPTATEEYHCRYGLNPRFESSLLTGPLRVTARDDDGDVRAVELTSHPFFVATLFQPERAALRDRPAPIVTAFVAAIASGAEVSRRSS